jgi:NADH-quinone oxidoreductase subunit H
MTARLRPSSPPRAAFLGLCALALIGIGLLFVIPVVNAAIVSLFWFFFKVSVVVYVMIWIRGTFPRFRYDQLMNIGWKVLIPLGMASILVNAIVGMASNQ